MKVKFVIVALVTCSGLILAWPMANAWVRYRMVAGRVMEVFPTALADGNVRLAVLYEFALPAERGRLSGLGYEQGDESYAQIPDPVSPAAEAAERAKRLKGQFFSVFYLADDPLGTAFLVNDRGWWRHRLGLALVVVGLALSVPTPLERQTRRRRA